MLALKIAGIFAGIFKSPHTSTYGHRWFLPKFVVVLVRCLKQQLRPVLPHFGQIN